MSLAISRAHERGPHNEYSTERLEPVVGERCIAVGSGAEWSEALEGIPHSFAHTWQNCRAMTLASGFNTYLYLFELDRVRIVCPISERTFHGYTDIVTPYGFSGFVGDGDCPDFAYHWTNFVQRKGYVCGYIQLNPILQNNTYFRPGSIHSYNEVYVLDLKLSEDELYERLSTNRRRQLRGWDRIASSLIFDKSALSDFFLANYSDFFCSKGAAEVYDFPDEVLTSILASPNVFMAGVWSSGNVQAVSVFAYTPYVGDYLFNVSLPQGRQYSVVLLWAAVKHLKALGVPLLNLGGGIRKNDGVAEFKQRFGGETFDLGSLKQVYRPEIYEELCRETGTDPNDFEGYFPAYRSP